MKICSKYVDWDGLIVAGFSLDKLRSKYVDWDALIIAGFSFDKMSYLDV